MHTLDRLAVGVRIREQREKLFMSKKDLAEKLNISLRFLVEVESGSRGVSLNKLMMLAQILEVSTDYLLFGSGEKSSEQVFSHIIENCPPSKREALAVIMKKIVDSYNE